MPTSDKPRCAPTAPHPDEGSRYNTSKLGALAASLRLDVLLDPTGVVLLSKIRRASCVATGAGGAAAAREECRPPVGIGNSVEKATDLLAVGLVFVSHARRVTGRAVKADPID